MGLFAQATDQTDKDFDGLRLKHQSLVRSVFADWTDLHVANFGNLLLPGQSGARPVSRPRPSDLTRTGLQHACCEAVRNRLMC
jgi:hypothetical protein